MVKLSHYMKRLFSFRLSPAFLVMLCISFLLWYIIKLGNTYTVELPVTLSLQGNRFNVTCVAEGNGHRLLKYRMRSHRPLNLRQHDLKLSEADSLGFCTIDPSSLQSVISLHYGDVRIISVENIPEVMVSNDTE